MNWILAPFSFLKARAVSSISFSKSNKNISQLLMFKWLPSSGLWFGYFDDLASSTHINQITNFRICYQSLFYFSNLYGINILFSSLQNMWCHVRIVLNWNTKSKKTGNDQELMQLNPTSHPHSQKTSTVNRMDTELFPKQVVIQLPQLKASATFILSLFVLIYFKLFFYFYLQNKTGPEVIKHFSCST